MWVGVPLVGTRVTVPPVAITALSPVASADNVEVSPSAFTAATRTSCVDPPASPDSRIDVPDT
ncbi:MAG: hypothetical protein RLZZ353_1492, partial [Actinomycetota bacterium]